MKQTFTKRILLFLFLVIPIPLILNLVVISFFSFSVTRNNLIATLYTHSSNLSLEFEKKLALHKIFIKRLANTLALKTFTASDEDFYTQAYREMSALSDSDFSLCLLPLSGSNIKTKNPHDPFIHYLKNHPEAKNQLRESSGQACILSLPDIVYGPRHYLVIAENLDVWESPRTTGLLVSFCPMDYLQNNLFKSISLKNEEICLFNQHGEVLCTSDTKLSHELFSLNTPSFPKIISKPQANHILPASQVLKSQELVSVKIQNKLYLGVVLNELPIQNTYTLSIVPFSSFVTKAIRLPLNIIFFYILTFVLMAWVLTKMNKRLNQPIQELTNCMEAAWRGNSHIRYEPHPYGYEINELGNIFNCTLLLLLNSKEKAEIEHISGDKLQKELAILSSLQQTLLSPPFPEVPNVQFTSKHLQGAQESGHFYGWKKEDNSLIGVIGMAGNVGLPSYLYALAARSLFLAYAHLTSSLEQISKNTFSALKETMEGNVSSVSMTFVHYHNSTLSILSVGDAPPAMFLKRNNTFFKLNASTAQKIESGDVVVCITGCKKLINHFSQLPIESLLKDSLSAIDESTNHFVDTLIGMLNSHTHLGGTVNFLTFS